MLFTTLIAELVQKNYVTVYF